MGDFAPGLKRLEKVGCVTEMKRRRKERELASFKSGGKKKPEYELEKKDRGGSTRRKKNSIRLVNGREPRRGKLGQVW